MGLGTLESPRYRFNDYSLRTRWILITPLFQKITFS